MQTDCQIRDNLTALFIGDNPLGARVADTVSEAAVGKEAPITIRADERAMQDVIFQPGRARIDIALSGQSARMGFAGPDRLSSLRVGE